MTVMCFSLTGIALPKACESAIPNSINVAGNQASTANGTGAQAPQIGLVPAPDVSTSNQARGGMNETNLAVGLNEGPMCGSTWSAHRSNMTNPGSGEHFIGEGFQGEIKTTLGGTMSDFEVNLGSAGEPSMQNAVMYLTTPAPQGSPNATQEIPISFVDAQNFTVSAGNVVYQGDLPTVKINCTFKDIAVEAPASGTINVVIQEIAICNWTALTIRIGSYVDVSNLQLPIPQGENYSFTFVYQFDMSNSTASNLEGHAVNYMPTNVTSTSCAFIGNNGTSKQISLADLNLADNYSTLEVSGQSAEREAISYFSATQAPNWAVSCYQTFATLTYGKTLGILSDPTITIQHGRISANEAVLPTNSPVPFIAIGAAVVASVVGIVSYKRRKRKVKRSLTNQ